jgi:hypothetical protein
VAQQATKRIGPQIAIVNLFVDRRHQSSTIDENAAIDTESNLKSDVFENICLCIGLNFLQSWQIEAPFIDDLFENRCAIAHGELLEPDSKYATEVLDAVLRWIDSFSTDIENAVVSKAYIRVR